MKNTKLYTLLAAMLIAMLVLSACGATATPTSAPTAAPVAEPTALPLTEEPAVEAPDAGALMANLWQWTSFTGPTEQFDVEMPTSYLVAFNEDGTLSIVADCNNAMGSYTDDAGSLTIEVGGMTKAMCPPESRSDEFVTYLGAAARYFFEDGMLYIDLFADGGTMAFAPLAAEESAGDLTSYPWLWASFTSPMEQFEVETPENYVLSFNKDGTVNIKADCNNAGGSYTTEGGSLSIEIGPMTKAACPPESRSDQFVTLLGSAALYFFEDAQLYIDLLADGGTMRFAPEGEAELADAAAEAYKTVAEAEAAGVTLICSAGDWAADCTGPRVITGEAGSGNFAVLPEIFPNPTVALIDVTNLLGGQPEVFVPESGQILGYFTEPLFPLPGQVQINLPFAPAGASLDLDNDGQEEAGVQVYALAVASNIILDSYLQQLEQGALSSYIMDTTTGAITEGTFLIYAPDAEQGFPVGSGADGRWFTADDPPISLPAGYTVATLSDGTVTLDRSPEVAINTIEPAEQVSPDFADQGILDSYHSLIDVLQERYAYTELRGLDWEEIRAQYLPQVEQADADQDIAAYYLVLDTFAKSLHDTHVAATTYNPEAIVAPLIEYQKQVGASVGASTIALIDEETPPEAVGDEIVVLTVGEDTPAEEAGWVPGTQILSIDGEPVSARLEAIPLLQSVGTETVRRKMQAQSVLRFPDGQTVTIAYRLPGATEVLTATMVAGAHDTGDEVSPPVQSATPVTYEQLGDYAVVRWSSFMDYILAKIAVLEEALAAERQHESGGVILDLRGNTGGWATLYETMASYFFTADDPMPVNVFDWYSYDLEKEDHVLSYAPDYMLSAPRPELAYTGPVVVLVDEGCASACEYFTQHLQVLDRATVIGQYPSSGAGGPVERVQMPGDITFQFTKGQTTFAGTDEPNLEARGVVPDIRVPVSLETEQAKAAGEDPVMEAALAAMPEIAAAHNAELLRRGVWQWAAWADENLQQIAVESPAEYTVAFGEDGTVAITADCNQAGGEYVLGEGGALTITPGPTTVAACEEGSRSEEFLAYLSAAVSFKIDANALQISLDPESGALALVLEAVEGAPLSAGALPAELVAQLDS
jgi:C-terminal processing protease CtpA/Prc